MQLTEKEAERLYELKQQAKELQEAREGLLRALDGILSCVNECNDFLERIHQEMVEIVFSEEDEE